MRTFFDSETDAIKALLDFGFKPLLGHKDYSLKKGETIFYLYGNEIRRGSFVEVKNGLFDGMTQIWAYWEHENYQGGGNLGWMYAKHIWIKRFEAFEDPELEDAFI